VITIMGVPDDSGVRSLARAALTQLHHGNPVLRIQQDWQRQTATAEVQIGGRFAGPIFDPALPRPALLRTLDDTQKGVV
jgi:hypothetical protein